MHKTYGCKWYCYLTNNNLQIVQAVCFLYRLDTDCRLHPKVRELDERYWEHREWFWSCFVDAYDFHAGETLTDIPAAHVIFATTEEERARQVQESWNKIAKLPIGQIVPFRNLGMPKSPFHEVCLGGLRNWSLPWVVITIGSLGFDTDDAMAFIDSQGFDGIPEWIVSSHVDQGARNRLPLPPIPAAEVNVLRRVMEELCTFKGTH